MFLHRGGCYKDVIHHAYGSCNALEHFIHDALENFRCTFQSKWKSQPPVPPDQSIEGRDER